MNNVVQNISIEDIIPSNIHPTNELDNSFNELINSIKKYGIIEPLVVRPKQNKYEIILGNRRYEAARQANLKSIPVLIKDMDDEMVEQYREIKNITNLNPKPEFLPNNNINNSIISNNSDIVNLSELNKKEYERTDEKMNNEQLNNNLMNNATVNPQTMNATANPQEPTFGGRFFPSLEDEPTNMNMGVSPINSPVQPPQPTETVNTNNLIDLTNIANEANQPIQTPINPAMPPQPELVQTPTNPTVEIPTPTVDPLPNVDTLNNVSIPQEPISTPIPEFQDFGTTPQFDMSQNLNLNEPQIDNNITPAIPEPVPTNVVPDTPILNTGEPAQAPVIPEVPAAPEMPTIESPVAPQKDISPVINTIKGLVTNLEAFGYKININEESLATSEKIIIEIEK